MTGFGKVLIVVGLLLAAAGVVVVLLGRSGVPVGRLPGDIVYRRGNFSFYFPVVTSVVVSLLLTLVLWIVNRWR